MADLAYINGRYLSIARAYVSVEDRGFQFGDGVYELIRTYNGHFFELDAHLGRLQRSASALGLPMVYSKARWKSILQRIHRKTGYKDARIYIQITRGAAPREHAFPKRIKPTLVVTARRFKPLPHTVWLQGASVITLPDIRWGRCDIKSINLLPNIMAKQKAKTSGAQEAIFVRDGLVTEGSSSNIFAVVGGQLVTTPKGPALLAGVTRDYIIRLAHEGGLKVLEKEMTIEEFYMADEVFLTGTTVEVLPVVRINGKVIGTGRPGSISQRLRKIYNQRTNSGGGSRKH